MGEALLALTFMGLLSWIASLLADLAQRQRGSRRPTEHFPPQDEVVVFRPRRQAREPVLGLPPSPFARGGSLASTQYRRPTKCRLCDHPFDHPVHLAHARP